MPILLLKIPLFLTKMSLSEELVTLSVYLLKKAQSFYKIYPVAELTTRVSI